MIRLMLPIADKTDDTEPVRQKLTLAQRLPHPFNSNGSPEFDLETMTRGMLQACVQSAWHYRPERRLGS